jgi:hypothetical protein
VDTDTEKKKSFGADPEALDEEMKNVHVEGEVLAKNKAMGSVPPPAGRRSAQDSPRGVTSFSKSLYSVSLSKAHGSPCASKPKYVDNGPEWEEGKSSEEEPVDEDGQYLPPSMKMVKEDGEDKVVKKSFVSAQLSKAGKLTVQGGLPKEKSSVLARVKADKAKIGGGDVRVVEPSEIPQLDGSRMGKIQDEIKGKEAEESGNAKRRFLGVDPPIRGEYKQGTIGGQRVKVPKSFVSARLSKAAPAVSAVSGKAALIPSKFAAAPARGKLLESGGKAPKPVMGSPAAFKKIQAGAAATPKVQPTAGQTGAMEAQQKRFQAGRPSLAKLQSAATKSRGVVTKQAQAAVDPKRYGTGAKNPATPEQVAGAMAKTPAQAGRTGAAPVASRRVVGPGGGQVAGMLGSQTGTGAGAKKTGWKVGTQAGMSKFAKDKGASEAEMTPAVRAAVRSASGLGKSLTELRYGSQLSPTYDIGKSCGMCGRISKSCGDHDGGGCCEDCKKSMSSVRWHDSHLK